MSQYMIRRRFFVPKTESERYYHKQYDKHPADFLFECDYDDTDKNE